MSQIQVLNWLQALNMGLKYAEQGDPEIITKPDQSLTIREIFDRFASGRNPNVERDVQYTGEQYVPNVAKLDMVDIDYLIDDNKAKIAFTENQVLQHVKDIKKSKSTPPVEQQNNQNDKAEGESAQ